MIKIGDHVSNSSLPYRCAAAYNHIRLEEELEEELEEVLEEELEEGMDLEVDLGVDLVPGHCKFNGNSNSNNFRNG